MKKIRVHISKIRNHFYAKIPDLIARNLNLDNGQDIEIIINSNPKEEQVELWDVHPEDVDLVKFFIGEEVHTMNMYNRIYIPEKFRFFFPVKEVEFLLITNVGNIKTHLTSNGYFTKGLRQWFHVNGPIMPNDMLKIKLINEDSFQYEMIYIKGGNENNN